MANYTGVSTDLNEQNNVGSAQSGALRSTGNTVAVANATGFGNGADTTDDVLFTYALPANALATPGAQVTITASGKFAANANNKQVKVWWGTTSQVVGSAVAGGTAIALSGVLTQNAGGWGITVQVQKYGVTNSNTQMASLAQVIVSTHLGTAAPVLLTAAENAPINITVTGSSSTTGAANDVVGMQFDVAFNN